MKKCDLKLKELIETTVIPDIEDRLDEIFADIAKNKSAKETENESNETGNINNDDDSNENDSDENDKDCDEYDKLIGKLDKIIIKGINYLLDKEGIMNIYTNNKLIKNLLLDDDGTPIGVYKNKKVYPLEF